MDNSEMTAEAKTKRHMLYLLASRQSDALRSADYSASDVMISRLPKQWLAFVQRALFEGVDGEAT